MHKVECEILGLSSSASTGGAYALLLKEVLGNRRLPIIIGQFEAQAIALELEGMKPPRPLTHDLLKSLIENLNASVLEVIISELRDNTFYAKIIIEVSTLTNEIDARPSDAIALALRANVPIYVAESVLEAAGFASTSDDNDTSQESTPFQEPKNEPAPSTREAKISALQAKLREALEQEDYERAAKIRDEIKKLSSNN